MSFIELKYRIGDTKIIPLFINVNHIIAVTSDTRRGDGAAVVTTEIVAEDSVSYPVEETAEAVMKLINQAQKGVHS